MTITLPVDQMTTKRQNYQTEIRSVGGASFLDKTKKNFQQLKDEA